MPDKKKLIEYGKSVIIVLLLVSAIVLMNLSGYYSNTMDMLGLIIHGGQDSGNDTEAGAMDAGSYGLAQAMQISISARDGHRYSSMYDDETVEEDYSRFSAFLAEALGSAAATEECDEAQWIRAIEGESVYIRYFAPQHISFLAVCLGTEFGSGESNMMAEEFCLSCENEAVYLYFRQGDHFYRCQSAVADGVLRERMGEYISNFSFFSHADNMLSGMRNSVLISRNISELPEFKGGSVSSLQFSEPLMLALDINEYTVSRYTESDGTEVYVDGNSILRISSYGAATYELSGESAVKASDSRLDSILELCWNIVGRTVGANCGAAELYFSQVDCDENGNYTVYFDYLMAGAPVWTGGRHAASFIFLGSSLESAEFYFRAYSQTGQTLRVLPMYQAAAIASAKGSEKLALMYYDTQESIECVWVNE